MLLCSDSVKVNSVSNDFEIKLTECSPEVDVVMNKQGGICTKCNVMFISRISLINHLGKCSAGSEVGGVGGVKLRIVNAGSDSGLGSSCGSVRQVGPKLIVVSN